MEDMQIIELYFDRSDNAIPETAKKYGSYLKTIAVNLLRSPEDAEECVNDTYFRAWNAIPPQRPNAFKCWLAKIARNLSLDYFKKARSQKRGGTEQGRETELLFSELEECIPSSSDTQTAFEDEVTAGLIGDFLQSREQECRIIFVRRYWYGDSINRISKRLNIGEGKIKSSLFRTRKALKAFLEKEGVLV